MFLRLIVHSKKILILGSGFVVSPVVEYLSKIKEFDLIIVGLNPSQSFIKKDATVVEMDVMEESNQESLEHLINQSDVVIR